MPMPTPMIAVSSGMTGGDQGAEGDGQHDEGDQDPDALGGTDCFTGPCEGVPADGDGQVGALEVGHSFLHRGLVRGGELAGRAV